MQLLLGETNQGPRTEEIIKNGTNSTHELINTLIKVRIMNISVRCLVNFSQYIHTYTVRMIGQRNVHIY